MVLVRTADLEEVVVRNLVLICIKENLGSTAAGFHHIRFLKYLYSKYNRYAICLIEMSFSTSEIAGNFAIDFFKKPFEINLKFEKQLILLQSEIF